MTGRFRAMKLTELVHHHREEPTPPRWVSPFVIEEGHAYLREIGPDEWNAWRSDQRMDYWQRLSVVKACREAPHRLQWLGSYL